MNTNCHLREFCKKTSLPTLNGRCGVDKHSGKFSFNSHAGQSVIDYVLVSRDLYKHIDEFSVDDPNIISDQSILRFTMPISVANEETDTQEDVFESVTYKYEWKSDNIDSFKNNRSKSYGIQERLTTEQINNECIDEAVDVLVNTLENCASSFRKDLFNPNADTNTSSPDSQQNRLPWYTETCREKKLIFY